MRRGSGVQAIGPGLFLQTVNAFHNSITLLRNGTKHLQEGAGVHGMALLYRKRVIAIGNIGHGHYALIPHIVHGFRELPDLVFQGLRVPELVDLVYETCHARPLPEQPLHVRKLHMAVGVHKARAQDSVQENFFGRWIRAHTRTHNRSVLLHLHKAIHYGLRSHKRVQIFGSETFHCQLILSTRVSSLGLSSGR